MPCVDQQGRRSRKLDFFLGYHERDHADTQILSDLTTFISENVAPSSVRTGEFCTVIATYEWLLLP